MIDAGACGTPVIALNKGAMPELIRDGKNGFLVSDENGAVEDLDRTGELFHPMPNLAQF